MHINLFPPRSGWSWTRSMSVSLNEMAVSWQFISGDVSAAVVPPLIFIIAAWHSQAASFSQLLWTLAQGSLLFFLYIYTFCVSNQLAGLAEDRLNKPHRPLVAGRVSVRGAQWRWLIAMALYALLGWWLGVLEWVILWQIVLVLHNFGTWAKHWFTKNFSMLLGTLAQLAAAWQLVAPITPDAWRWISMLSLMVFSLATLQDLRDIAGDRISNRRTLPIVWGEKPTRYLLTLGFSMLPLFLYRWLLLPAGDGLVVMLCGLVLAALCWLIAARIVLCRSQRADHETYLLFTYTYCAILSTAVIIF